MIFKARNNTKMSPEALRSSWTKMRLNSLCIRNQIKTKRMINVRQKLPERWPTYGLRHATNN